MNNGEGFAYFYWHRANWHELDLEGEQLQCIHATCGAEWQQVHRVIP